MKEVWTFLRESAAPQRPVGRVWLMFARPERLAAQSSRAARFAMTLGLVAAAGAVIAACGGQAGSVPPSAAAVCHVWDTDGLALHNEYQGEDNAYQGDPNDTNNLLSMVGSLLTFPTQIATLMTRMANVAPSPIKGDLQNLATIFNQESANEAKAITDPLGAIGSGVLGALEGSGSVTRVDQFLAAHCASPRKQAP